MMKKIGLWIMVAMSTTLIMGQTLKEWDNVAVNSLNRVRAHTLEIPVESSDAASSAYTPTNALEASPYYLNLNGTWKFQWVGTPEQASKTFYQDSFDASSSVLVISKTFSCSCNSQFLMACSFIFPVNSKPEIMSKPG